MLGMYHSCCRWWKDGMKWKVFIYLTPNQWEEKQVIYFIFSWQTVISFLVVSPLPHESTDETQYRKRVCLCVQAAAEEKPAWSVLRDDFMMGATMKDWDKDSDREEADTHSGWAVGESDSDWQTPSIQKGLCAAGCDAFRDSLGNRNLDPENSLRNILHMSVSRNDYIRI